MRNDMIFDSITNRALYENFSIKEKKRREEAEINVNFYYDRAKEYVERVNHDVSPTTINMVKVIAHKRATMLYSQKLLREFDGPAASVKFIKEFYEFIDIDSFLLKVDLASELTGTGLVHIATDTTNDFGINLQLFSGRDISILSNVDDPNKPEAISIIRTVNTYDKQVRNSKTVIKQQIWTDKKVRTYNNGAEANPAFEKEQSHSLPAMPFVAFNGEEVDGQCVGHPPITSVRLLNQSLNELLTNLNYMIKMESFTPIAVEGFESGSVISLHPGKALNLPMGSKAYTLNFDPKIDSVIAAIKYIEDKVYDTSSVPKVSILGGEASSGRELMIKWFPLVQVFKEKSVRWNKYEHKLVNMILKLIGLDPIPYMLVRYPDDTILPMSAEKDDLLSDIKLNIKTPIDEIMRRDPELTEEEAQAEFLANRDINSMVIMPQESVL